MLNGAYTIVSRRLEDREELSTEILKKREQDPEAFLW